jgi:hypothetical protein
VVTVLLSVAAVSVAAVVADACVAVASVAVDAGDELHALIDPMIVTAIKSEIIF